MSKRKIENDDLDFDIESEEDLEELEHKLGFALDQYDVDYPGEPEIVMTIDAIRPYVPLKVNRSHVFFESMSSIMKQSLQEIFYISPLFWISNGLFLIFGLVAVFIAEQSPYLSIMLLAPIPTISGLIEVLKSRNTGMAELEMSLKYSLQEIILSRMLVVGTFNLVFNLIFTFSMSFFHPDIWFWKLLIYWITPFTVITALSFIFVSRFKNSYTAILGLVSWVVFGGLISQESVVNKLDSAPTALYIVITVIATLVVLIQAKQIYTRGVTYEFNH